MSIVDELVANLGFGFRDCQRIISTAPARYYVFKIPKRSGGTRTIAHPARELKAIQRYILEEKLNRFPIHDAATAYKKNTNIHDNASRHLYSHSILKSDFKEFFPSIIPSDWTTFAQRQKSILISSNEISIYAKILFWGKEKNNTVPQCLSIGAPTSPAISNILLYDFDEKCTRVTSALNVVYSRYADDITLSASSADALLKAEAKIKSLLNRMRSPNLVLNEAKRGLFTKSGRRSVTGLILTPDKKVSIGRDRKRLISAMMHRLSLDELSIEQRGFLKGMLGFCIAVEPVVLDRLRSKYGSKLVDVALRYYIPKKDIDGSYP